MEKGEIYSMAPKPRYVLPLNFREADKPLLDQIVFLAKKEDANITTVVRSALSEFAARRRATLEQGETHKIEEFCLSNFETKSSLWEMLTPAELKGWEDGELLNAARRIRGRQQEIDSELRKRGYFFSW